MINYVVADAMHACQVDNGPTHLVLLDMPSPGIIIKEICLTSREPPELGV